MTKNNQERIATLIFLSSVILLFLWVAMYLKGCGLEPTKKTVIEREVVTAPIPVAEDPVCEGADGNPSRTQLCSEGQQGIIVEVCDDKGEWQVAANSCQPIAEVENPVPPEAYDLDYMETLQLAHLTTVLDDDDRLNTVFVNMVHAVRLGLDMNAQYDALNRALNSVSFEQKITKCEPIDSVGSVCAFDGRDLGINEAEFALIIENASRAFESKTTKGAILAQLLGRNVSALHYDDFIATLLGNAVLYNQLMNFQDAVQVYSLFGINVAKQVQDVDYACIGTNESGISAAKNTRLICVFEGNVNGRDTSCWLTFDNPALDGADRDLFQSPFIDRTRSQKIFNFEASESICTLPNGLQAYILANAGGALQGFAPENIVFCNNNLCLDGTINTPSDCFNCHQDGIIPKDDVIRDHVISSGAFNADEVELAKAIYLEHEDGQELIADQNEDYAQALNAMGIKFGDKNHTVENFNAFFRLQSKAQVAAYLMISEQTLEECINSSALLSSQIGTLLTSGRITQEAFSTAFNDILNECRINVDPLVRPQ